MFELLETFETNGETILQLCVDVIVRGVHHAPGSRYLSSSEWSSGWIYRTETERKTLILPRDTFSPSSFPFSVIMFFSSSLVIRRRTSLGFSPGCGCVMQDGVNSEILGFHSLVNRVESPGYEYRYCNVLASAVVRHSTEKKIKKENRAAKPHRQRFRRVVCFTSCLWHVHFSGRKKGSKWIYSRWLRGPKFDNATRCRVFHSCNVFRTFETPRLLSFRNLARQSFSAHFFRFRAQIVHEIQIKNFDRNKNLQDFVIVCLISMVFFLSKGRSFIFLITCFFHYGCMR